MMKHILLSLLFFYTYTSFSQNVGIGTNSPVEKLDVNGNVNIQGQLKVNGNAGNNGQVLAKDAANNLSWLDFANYPDFSSFDCATVTNTAGAGNCGTSWTVPAGVSVILVEGWAGGGGGCSMSGGAGGAYIAARVAGTAGTVVSLTIGAGGNYGSSSSAGTAGGNTNITIGAISISAFGGLGGASGDPHFVSSTSPTVGGAFSTAGITANQYIGYVGNHGYATIIDYRQVSSTDFAKVINFGNGGDAGNAPGSGGRGGYQIYSITSGVLYTVFAQSQAPMPGGGGGADHTYGFNGRGGRVVIHW